MKIDLLFRKGSLWIGAHWSVNLLPCVTLRIKLDPLPTVTVGRPEIPAVHRCANCNAGTRRPIVAVDGFWVCSMSCLAKYNESIFSVNEGVIAEVVSPPQWNNLASLPRVEHITFAYKDSGKPATVTAGIKDMLEVRGEDVYLNGEQVINIRAVQTV